VEGCCGRGSTPPGPPQGGFESRCATRKPGGLSSSSESEGQAATEDLRLIHSRVLPLGPPLWAGFFRALRPERCAMPSARPGRAAGIEAFVGWAPPTKRTETWRLGRSTPVPQVPFFCHGAPRRVWLNPHTNAPPRSAEPDGSRFFGKRLSSGSAKNALLHPCSVRAHGTSECLSGPGLFLSHFLIDPDVLGPIHVVLKTHAVLTTIILDPRPPECVQVRCR